jgi:hypothetical protein
MVAVAWLSGGVRIVHVARLLSQIEIMTEARRGARGVHDSFTDYGRWTFTFAVKAIADYELKAKRQSELKERTGRRHFMAACRQRQSCRRRFLSGNNSLIDLHANCPSVDQYEFQRQLNGVVNRRPIRAVFYQL